MLKQSFFLILATFAVGYLSAAPFSIYDAMCDNEASPVGVERAAPCFGWKLYSAGRDFRQTAYRIVVATTPELLERGVGDCWDSGRVNSSESVLVPYEGAPLSSGKTYYWRVTAWSGKDSAVSRTGQWSMGLLDEEAWGGARWIALEPDRRDELLYPELGIKPQPPKTAMYTMPLLRREFGVNKEVKRAFAYVSGMGHFEMMLNGRKVGRNFLDPGWTKYDREALYVTFDVTDMLARGANAVGIALGNGFYNIPNDGERYTKLLASYGAPKARCVIRIEYADGTLAEVATDGTWKASPGPTTYSSIYSGEDYDARLEQRGWSSAGFDDAGWQAALPVAYDARLVSQRSEPLAVRSKITPVRIFRNRAGGWVYDLGQNFSGVVEVSLKGAAGARTVLWPAELLNADSTINQSATGRPFYFAYTASGDGAGETWQPRFTYYGFRYVQLEGAVPAGMENPEGLPEVVALAGLHTALGAPEAGSFSCSKPMFNQIHDLIDWAMRSNMASVLTDCPHREKLGWLEETHLMQYSLQYRYNLARLYGKTLSDMRTAQLDNGCIPTIAPEYVRFANGFEDTPEWGSAYIISPWYIYHWYGDSRLLEEHYPNMRCYVDYLGSRAEGHIVAYGLGDWFDIGPKSPGYAQLTSNALSATAMYYYDVTLMQKIATLLGKQADADAYAALAVQIREAFNRKFFDPQTKKYERNSQTASAMALFMGLVEEENRAAVLDNLIDDISGRDWALTAGDVGYRYVLRALEAAGRSDVIFNMNSRYDVPGYGWQLAHGATALTESWQAYGFVSNNHFMLGHLMEWLYGGLGGIRQQEGSVAFGKILIDPQPAGDVTSARTSYESPYGTITCRWEIQDGEFVLETEIPANAEAVVCLPAGDVSQVTEHGAPLSQMSLRTVREGSRLRVGVGSGKYLFRVADPLM